MLGASVFPAPQRDRAIQWVFLDRDGTLNAKPPDGEYIEHPEALELLPGAAEAVRAFNRAGVWTGVVTNQRGVALGRMSIEDLNAIHERLMHLLSAEGAFLDAIYVCWHQIGTCGCRKPDPGMLLKARSDHPGLDFARAAIVGDSPNDMQAGRRVGLTTVMISADVRDQTTAVGVDHVVADLAAAALVLTGDRDHPGGASAERGG